MAKDKPKTAMAALLDFSTEQDGPIEEPMPVAIRPTFQVQQNINENIGRLIEIEPSQCKLWRYADRPNDELGDLEALAKSLKDHGQQEPILVRPTAEDSQQPYEIIFGNRRWRAASLADIKIQAICKPITDQQAALYQKEENENRKELSDYARAISYRAQIDGGVFKSETELSKFLGISKQSLNDLMAYLRVPENIRIAIRGFKYLPKSTVIKIATCAKNKDYADAIMMLSEKISSKSINATNLEKKLQEYLSPKMASTTDVYVKKNDDGKSIFKFKRQANGSIVITIGRAVALTLDENNLMDQFADAIEASRNHT